MKFLIVFVALFAVALAVSIDADATILKQDSDVGPVQYNYGYETSNGVSAQEAGQLLNAGSDHESIAVKGSYQYVGDDGVTYSVSYIADENGFQPQGAHLPVAP
ncbi:larval cuticle protein 65Ag1-like [Drosophila eugracilis]|uniref:larval cuticle protein 65Ag1-like n=1 Tax=Drosophila eugracilis TaxID=29029 RepID=UPI0007E5E911|nr:larval cuticle protein 65Ag1-like [Drosophila eugracilis]